MVAWPGGIVLGMCAHAARSSLVLVRQIALFVGVQRREYYLSSCKPQLDYLFLKMIVSDHPRFLRDPDSPLPHQYTGVLLEEWNEEGKVWKEPACLF